MSHHLSTPPRDPVARRRRAALAGVLVFVLVVTSVVGTALVLGVGGTGSPGVAAPATVTVTATPDAEPTREPRKERPDPGPAPEPSSPDRLVIPAVGIDAPVVPIQNDGTELAPPADPDVVGWWTGSALPGAVFGQTVVTGHTVHTGGGAMSAIEALSEGDRVVLRAEGSRMVYRVTLVIDISKEGVAEYASGLFGQQRVDPEGARLMLVTCTDWDGSEWQSNIVTFAEPVGLKAA
ncbi:MAG: peptidase C60 sortase A and B [Nocardioides sp.]|nr:peptidase C60 sortase A and B [Nocardioides sp.]